MRQTNEADMLGWAIAFFIAAIGVGALGAGSNTTLSEMAKVLFWVFLGFMALSLALHFTRTRA
ncbi:MAG TPA: hypothetical protein VKX49_13750 [Bryobacteraceae bacterium]|nr:hypothetical protein [Bryobacteraceae bacterium]